MRIDPTVSDREAITLFFRDPPWKGGVPRYKVGLAPVETGDWLPEAATAADVARKQHLYATRFNDVVALRDEALPHVAPFLDLLQRHCASRGFPAVAGGHGEWADAALRVPDDLCLMVRSGDRHVLAAASLCAPSFWTLREKLGLPLTGLHAGHRGLNDLLAARMQAVFDRLPEDRVLERRNWFLHGPSALFEPRDRTIELPVNLADCIVRTERQALRRLDAACIIFSIRVRLMPFAAIRDFPEAAADMAKTVRALTPAEQEAFSVRHRLAELLRYLDAVTSEPETS
jgi:hypothetical protein